MPYSGADDAKLPSNVKKLPAAKRVQWANVWNSAHSKCVKDGKGDCEASAFRQANGVAKKSLDDTWDVYSRQLSQGDAGYNPVGGSGEKACSNCHWFSSPDGCILVAGDIAPNGLSAHWRERMEYVPTPMPVEITNWDEAGAKELMPAGGCGCLACVADDDEGPLGIKATWTTKYVNSLPDSSFAYVESGCDTGSCRHFPYKNADGVVDLAHLRNALARVPQSPHGPKAKAKLCSAAKSAGVDASSCESSSKSLIDTVRSWFYQGSAPNPAPPVEGAVRVVKALGPDGEPAYRAFLIYSNNFMDRHGQIVREAAHKDYEDWVEEHAIYPEFWLWHTEGTTWGQADQITQIGHFMVASGPVHKGYEHIAETLAATDGLAVSFGFYKEETPDKKEVIRYRAFEVSPLPMEHAANVWTGADFVKGEDMALTQARKGFLKQVGVSDEFITNLENGLVAKGTTIEGAGVAHKATDGDGQGAAPEGAEGPPEGGDGGAVVPVDMMVDMMQQMMQPMITTMQALQQGQKSLEDGLAKSIKEAAEDMNLAAIQKLPQGHKATEDPNNVVPGAPSAPDDGTPDEFNWLGKEPVFSGMFGRPDASD